MDNYNTLNTSGSCIYCPDGLTFEEHNEIVKDLVWWDDDEEDDEDDNECDE